MKKYIRSAFLGSLVGVAASLMACGVAPTACPGLNNDPHNCPFGSACDSVLDNVCPYTCSVPSDGSCCAVN
jgi:hypothetical protein